MPIEAGLEVPQGFISTTEMMAQNMFRVGAAGKAPSRTLEDGRDLSPSAQGPLIHLLPASLTHFSWGQSEVRALCCCSWLESFKEALGCQTSLAVASSGAGAGADQRHPKQGAPPEHRYRWDRWWERQLRERGLEGTVVIWPTTQCLPRAEVVESM